MLNIATPYTSRWKDQLATLKAHLMEVADLGGDTAISVRFRGTEDSQIYGPSLYGSEYLRQLGLLQEQFGLKVIFTINVNQSLTNEFALYQACLEYFEVESVEIGSRLWDEKYRLSNPQDSGTWSAGVTAQTAGMTIEKYNLLCEDAYTTFGNVNYILCAAPEGLFNSASIQDQFYRAWNLSLISRALSQNSSINFATEYISPSGPVQWDRISELIQALPTHTPLHVALAMSLNTDGVGRDTVWLMREMIARLRPDDTLYYPYFWATAVESNALFVADAEAMKVPYIHNCGGTRPPVTPNNPTQIASGQSIVAQIAAKDALYGLIAERGYDTGEIIIGIRGGTASQRFGEELWPNEVLDAWIAMCNNHSLQVIWRINLNNNPDSEQAFAERVISRGLNVRYIMVGGENYLDKYFFGDVSKPEVTSATANYTGTRLIDDTSIWITRLGYLGIPFLMQLAPEGKAPSGSAREQRMLNYNNEVLTGLSAVLIPTHPSTEFHCAVHIYRRGDLKNTWNVSAFITSLLGRIPSTSRLLLTESGANDDGEGAISLSAENLQQAAKEDSELLSELLAMISERLIPGDHSSYRQSTGNLAQAWVTVNGQLTPKGNAFLDLVFPIVERKGTPTPLRDALLLAFYRGETKQIQKGISLPVALPSQLSDLTGKAKMYSDIIYRGKERCKFDLITPVTLGPWPVAVFIHGGGFKVGDKSAMYAVTGGSDSERQCTIDLINAGVACIGVNYSLVSVGLDENEGIGRKSLNDMLIFLLSIQEFAHLYNLDTSRIALHGRSAGGNAAIFFSHINFGGKALQGIWSNSSKPTCVAARRPLPSLDPVEHTKLDIIIGSVSQKVIPLSVEELFYLPAEGGQPAAVELAQNWWALELPAEYPSEQPEFESFFRDPVAHNRNSVSAIFRKLYSAASSPLYIYQPDDKLVVDSNGIGLPYSHNNPGGITLNQITHNPSAAVYIHALYSSLGVECQVNGGGNTAGIGNFSLVDTSKQDFIISKLL